MVPEVVRLTKVGVCGCGQLVPRGERAGYAPALDKVVCLHCLETVQGGPRRRFRVARETFDAAPPAVPPTATPAPTSSPSSPVEPVHEPRPTPAAPLELGRAARRQNAQQSESSSQHASRLAQLLRWAHGATEHGRPTHSAVNGSVVSQLDVAPHVLALHHRALPGRRATIDHVVVGPAGVYVVDTHDVGRLTVKVRRSPQASTETGDDLVVGRHTHNHLLGALAARVEFVRLALAAAGLSDVPVVPALCFVDGMPSLRERHLRVGETHVVGPKGLVQLASTGGPLDEQQRSTLHAMFDSALPAAPQPSVAGSG